MFAGPVRRMVIIGAGFLLILAAATGLYLGLSDNTGDGSTLKVRLSEGAPARQLKEPASSASELRSSHDALQPATKPAPVGRLQELQPDGAIADPVVTALPISRDGQRRNRLSHLPDPALVETSAHGPLPVIAADGRRPLDVYARAPDTDGNFGVARVVIVVGGIGISQTGSQQAIRQLPANVTLAFSPYGNSLKRWARSARQDGHEILLQVPMEPYGYPQNNPGAETLRTGVAAAQNLDNLHWAMGKITNFVGVMNYLGGKFVTDQAALQPVFDDIARRGLAYLDDGSAANNRSAEISAAAVMPFRSADLLIDAVRTRKNIITQLGRLEREAKRTGIAIGVASAFPETIALIAEFARKAGAAGIEITPFSAVVEDPTNND